MSDRDPDGITYRPIGAFVYEGGTESEFEASFDGEDIYLSVGPAEYKPTNQIDQIVMPTDHESIDKLIMFLTDVRKMLNR